MKLPHLALFFLLGAAVSCAAPPPGRQQSPGSHAQERGGAESTNQDQKTPPAGGEKPADQPSRAPQAAPTTAPAPDESGSDVVIPPPLLSGEETFVADAVALVEKLKITPEQRPAYDVVVADIRGRLGSETRRSIRERLSDLRSQIDQAQADKNTERVRELRQEIRALRARRDGLRPYHEFFERINPILTPEQREAAKALQGPYLAKTLPDDSVPRAMPEQMLEIARGIDVNPQQRRQLQKLELTYLPELKRSRAIDQGEYRQMKQKLRRTIHAILNDEQRALFEAQLDERSGRDDPSQSATADPRFMIEVVQKMDLNERQRENLKKVEEEFGELIQTVRPKTDRARYQHLRQRVKIALFSVLETQEQKDKLEAAIAERRSQFMREGKSLEEFGDEDTDDGGGEGGGGG